MPKYLIVNADDFGLCRGVNRGIIECFERGIVTSTSLIVRPPAAGEAAAYARNHPQISVGLHLDLGEWISRDGEWQPLYQVVDIHDAAAVQKEIAWQLAEFRRLVGRDPTHLDSHQHAHSKEPVRSAALALARSLGVVLRGNHPAIRYCGHFYGQEAEGSPRPGAISVAALEEILARLPEGITELCCHPGYPEDLQSIYQQEREEEVRVLCDPAAYEFLAGQNIILGSFDQFADLIKGH
jgi:predicted glycoside hydrolase/deacetylase ChbG (UPF0249 family)